MHVTSSLQGRFDSCLGHKAKYFLQIGTDLENTFYNNMKYDKIQHKSDYMLLLNSGMFYEMHPELSGNWDVDKKVIKSESQNCKEMIQKFTYKEHEFKTSVILNRFFTGQHSVATASLTDIAFYVSHAAFSKDLEEVINNQQEEAEKAVDSLISEATNKDVLLLQKLGFE